MAAPARGFTRDQRTTIVYGILGFVVVLVILQLWMLTATMNAYLGGDRAVIWPAGLASTACLLLNAGLLRYLRRLEQAAARAGGR
ncbi:MAG TPA: DUF6755 family protein [Myxococcaceae bacterium]